MIKRVKPSQLPPPPEKIGERVAGFCREHGIVRMDLFGSVARGDAGPGSDVDLIATFREIPGIEFFSLEDELKRLLGVRVNLLIAEDLIDMKNPYLKTSIEQDRRTIYAASA